MTAGESQRLPEVRPFSEKVPSQLRKHRGKLTLGALLVVIGALVPILQWWGIEHPADLIGAESKAAHRAEVGSVDPGADGTVDARLDKLEAAASGVDDANRKLDALLEIERSPKHRGHR